MNLEYYIEERIDVTQGVSAISFIKSKNLIRYGYNNFIVSDIEKDFLVGLFKKHLNGLHKSIPITQSTLYCVFSDIRRFYSNKMDIKFINEDYVYGERPFNDLYFTYGFKINRDQVPEEWKPYEVIQYILRYINIIYGLPKAKFNKILTVKIMVRDHDRIIGV